MYDMLLRLTMAGVFIQDSQGQKEWHGPIIRHSCIMEVGLFRIIVTRKTL